MYITEASNRVSDALYRNGEEKEEGDMKLRVIAIPYWQDFQEVLDEVESDKIMRKITEEVRTDPNSHPAYTLEHDRLHYKGRLMLFA